MQRSRHAFTIIELIAAAAILAVLVGALVPATLLVQQHRRELAVHRQALQAADNLLERVLTLPWSELEAGLSGEAIRTDDVLADVPGGTWKLTVVDVSSGGPAKRATVQVSYGGGARSGAVALTAWAFRDGQSNSGPMNEEP